MQFEAINIEEIKKIALDAGKIIMTIYNKDFKVVYKEDESPLTEADLESNKFICDGLKELYPTIPIMSEENKQTSYNERKNWDYYWCVDPIDGTKEFIKRNHEFTVNIALIHHNIPVLGVVYAPALRELYFAKKSQGAFKEVLSAKGEVLSNKRLPLISQKNLKEKITVVASKSHLSSETQEFIDNLALNTSVLSLTCIGSSLKLCLIATGEADIYPRLAPTMEWDTAAADAIVREVGKIIYEYDNKIFTTDFLSTINHQLKTMVYNKENLFNPWFVVI